jgi:hypothetical protein
MVMTGFPAADDAAIALIAANGKLILVGTTTAANDADYAAVRLLPNGSLDTTFGLAGTGGVIVDFATAGDTGQAAALQGDGYLVLSGETGGLFGLARLEGDPSPPAAPFGLTAAAATNPPRVILEWWDNSNETRYYVYRKVGAGGFRFCGSTNANQTAFTDTRVALNTTYTYRLRAANDLGLGPLSNEAAATTLGPPAAPSDLAGQAKTGPRRVELNWTDRSSSETKFYVYRKTGSGNYAFRGSVNANVTTFTDTTVAGGTTYTYHVKAWNEAGFSAASFPAATVSVP